MSKDSSCTIGCCLSAFEEPHFNKIDNSATVMVAVLGARPTISTSSLMATSSLKNSRMVTSTLRLSGFSRLMLPLILTSRLQMASVFKSMHLNVKQYFRETVCLSRREFVSIPNSRFQMIKSKVMFRQEEEGLQSTQDGYKRVFGISYMVEQGRDERSE